MEAASHTGAVVSGGLADQALRGLDPVQMMAAEVVAHHGLSKTQDELAALAGVSRTTLYRWRQTPAFKRAVAAAGRAMVQDVIPEAYQRLVQAMRKGERWAIERIVDIDQEASGAIHDRRMERYVEVMMAIVVPAVKAAGSDLVGAVDLSVGGFGRVCLDLPAGSTQIPADPQDEQTFTDQLLTDD